MSINIKIEQIFKRLKSVRRVTFFGWLVLFSAFTTYQFTSIEHGAPTLDDSVIIEVDGKIMEHDRSDLAWHQHINLNELKSVQKDEIQKIEIVISEQRMPRSAGSPPANLDEADIIIYKMATEWAPAITIASILAFIIGMSMSLVSQELMPTFAGIIVALMFNYGPNIILGVNGIKIDQRHAMSLVEVPLEQKNVVLAQVAKQLELTQISKLYAEKIDALSLKTREAKSQVIALKELVGVKINEAELASYHVLISNERSSKEKLRKRLEVVMSALSVLLVLLATWLHLLNNNYQIIRKYVY
jgi:hypothetical protein